MFWILVVWGVRNEDVTWRAAITLTVIWGILLSMLLLNIGPFYVWLAGMGILDAILLYKNGILDSKIR
ncbi:MAG TPA: hypothetical protein VK171_09270 [Fimbriimonas sp.]|nr:hypothetical protein [Fimbriimonas sp.]